MTEKKESDTLKEVLAGLLEYLQRDHELRRSHLEHNRADLRHRRWKTAGLMVLIGVPAILYTLVLIGAVSERTVYGDYVAVLRIEGEIGPNYPASATRLLPAIKQAFEDKKAKGVVLVVNSPGGTPVQASIVYESLIRMQKEHPDKPLIAVGEDLATSGAYWIAAAAKEIYVNESTIVGSVGVMASGFGVDLSKLRQFGLERRLITAGEFKARGDMFMRQREVDVVKTKSVVSNIHEHFMQAVLRTRKEKLKAEEKVVFSGDYWTGKQALGLGLVDGLSDLAVVLKEKFGVDTYIDYTPRQNLFDTVKRSFSAASARDWLREVVSHDGDVAYQVR